MIMQFWDTRMFLDSKTVRKVVGWCMDGVLVSGQICVWCTNDISGQEYEHDEQVGSEDDSRVIQQSLDATRSIK